jgi:TIR domain
MPEDNNEPQYDVFISWSGNRSKHVALALRDLLAVVIQAAKPFMSKADMDKGSRWQLELAKALEGTKVGIVCLTPENPSAPWLLFESGALSKTLDRGTRLFTYLLAGLQPQEVVPPLGDFQATKAEKEETLQMLQDANKALGLPISERILNNTFDLAWPKFATALASMPEPEGTAPPKRTVDDMFGEIVNLVRNQNKLWGGAFTGEDFNAALIARASKALTANGIHAWSTGIYTEKILFSINPGSGGKVFVVVIPTNTSLGLVEAVVRAQLPAPKPPPPPPPPPA